MKHVAELPTARDAQRILLLITLLLALGGFCLLGALVAR